MCAPHDVGVEIAVRLRLVCEAHDSSIGPHLDRVSRFACELGGRLGLSAPDLAELGHATPLHDVGKIGIPLPLLKKKGKLTLEETRTVRTHTLIGHRILDGSDLPLIRRAASIALSHHESWDGGGYPQGLAGEKIPFDARIVAVADVFDALLSVRAYKEAWSEDRAIAEIRRLRGTKFDPDILDTFLNHLPALGPGIAPNGEP